MIIVINYYVCEINYNREWLMTIKAGPDEDVFAAIHR